MDRLQSESPVRIGSMKADNILNGERIHGGKPDKYITHIPFSEDSPPKTRELHLAKMNICRLNETTKLAANEKAQAESELHSTRTAAKELAQKIEESNSNARVQKLELHSLKKHEEQAALVGEMSNDRYMEVLRELGIVKHQLSKLKFDMAFAIEEKKKAKKEIEASDSRTRSYLTSAEDLRKAIEEANIEQLLVELARIAADREFREIETQREAEAAQFSKTIEKTKKRIRFLRKEMNRAKELEMKLEIINSEVTVLQNEMELVRAMETNFGKNKRKEEELETSSSLQTAEAELKAAKKELARIKEVAFQLMASMDLVREELKQIAEEKERFKRLENKADSTVQSLNSNLLKAKSKLESASVTDERAKALVSGLSEALQQLQEETEAAKKEKELISEETKSIKLQIEKNNLDVHLAEERLQAAAQELEAVKASEAIALEKLSTLAERTMRNRAYSSLHSSTITISEFEYNYLSRHAKEAQEVADKKAAMAQAWTEVLKVGEKETRMRTEMVQREIRDLRIIEVKELHKMQKALVAWEAVEEKLYNLRQNEGEAKANLQEIAKPGRSFREIGVPIASRTKIRRLSNSARMRNISRPPSSTIKRRKAMSNLVKFLTGRRIGKQK